MIYFIIVVSIIAADKILKEYFKSSFRGKHRKVCPENTGMGIKLRGQQREQMKQKKNKNKDGYGMESDWRKRLTPRIELL